MAADRTLEDLNKNTASFILTTKYLQKLAFEVR